MHFSTHKKSGIAILEIIVMVFVGGIFLFVVVGGIFALINQKYRPSGISTLANARQIQIATQSAALDRETTGGTNIIGWPGMNVGFSSWLTNMGSNAYLTTNDLRKLFSAPGIIIKGLPQYAMGKSAFRIYQVSSNSPSETVFISTFNWNAEASNVPLSPNSVPYGDKGFIIMHKTGDGATYKGSQATNTNLFGTLTNNIAP